MMSSKVKVDRGVTIGLWILSLPATLFILLPYLLWILAWVEIGHPPRLYQDDPKFIGGFVSDVRGLVIIITLILVWLSLVCLVGALPLQVIEIKQRTQQKNYRDVVLGIVPMVVWLLYFMQVAFDPTGVSAWLGD